MRLQGLGRIRTTDLVEGDLRSIEVVAILDGQPVVITFTTRDADTSLLVAALQDENIDVEVER